MSPDGPTSPPPEERLLNLIRKQTRPQPITPAANPSPSPTAGGAALVLVRRMTVPWSTIAGWSLGVILVAEVLYVLILAIQPIPHIVITSTVSAPVSEAMAATLDDVPSLAASATPTLFQAEGMGSAVPTVRPTGPVSGTTKLLASRLNLMGIVSGNPPQAIIEDTQTKKTYFVTAGQPVVEGAVLEQVLDNRVVLDINGEKIELAL